MEPCTSHSDEPTLKRLWNNRSSLEWSPQSLLSVIVSECGNGNICDRPWGTIVNGEDLVVSLANGLLNAFYLIFRAADVGIKQRPFMKALSYLILVALDSMSSDEVAEILEVVWDLEEGRPYSRELQELILGPVLNTLISEMRDVCVNNCQRVGGDRVTLQLEEIERYWDRLSTREDNEVMDDEPKKFLQFESYTIPCAVGFVVDKEKGCPICHIDSPEKDIPAMLEIIKEIIQKRKYIRF